MLFSNFCVSQFFNKVWFLWFFFRGFKMG